MKRKIWVAAMTATMLVGLATTASAQERQRNRRGNAEQAAPATPPVSREFATAFGPLQTALGARDWATADTALAAARPRSGRSLPRLRQCPSRPLQRQQRAGRGAGRYGEGRQGGRGPQAPQAGAPRRRRNAKQPPHCAWRGLAGDYRSRAKCPGKGNKVKRSVNLKGNRWGGASQQAKNLIATLRWLGYTDAQIVEELRKWQAEQDAAKQRAQESEVQP